MPFFDIGVFAHALKVYNTVRGNAPEELLYDPNAEQTARQHAHAARRESNRAWDALEREQKGLKERNKKYRDGRGNEVTVAMVLAHYAADRKAIHQTLIEMEVAWERGDNLAITCMRASEGRKAAFAKILATPAHMHELVDPLHAQCSDTPEGLLRQMETLQVSRHFQAPEWLPKMGPKKNPYDTVLCNEEVATGLLLQGLMADRLALLKATDAIEKAWVAGSDPQAAYREAAEVRRAAVKDKIDEIDFQPWAAVHYGRGCAPELKRTPRDWEAALVDKHPLSPRPTAYFFVQKEPFY